MIGRLVAGLSVLGALALHAGIAGCAAREEPAIEAQEPQIPLDGVWTPSSDVALPNTSRGRMYALTHAPRTDVLVYEQLVQGPSGEPIRATWIVRIPSVVGMETDIELTQPGAATLTDPAWLTGEDGAPLGWLIETRADGQSHAAPLTGRVRLSARTDRAIIAHCSLSAERVAPGAGMARSSHVTLDRRMGFVRRVPETIRSEQNVGPAR